MRKRREKYLLYFGVLLALLPVVLLRDFTPGNELRYLSIADEALLRHTFFAFTNHGVPYADKPPLYLWLLMACRTLAGCHAMWLLSLLSLLPALGIMRVMDNWTLQETDADTRAVARLMLITSVLFMGGAITLRMDMLMSLFVLLSLHSFWRLSRGGAQLSRERWLFPLWLFLGLFTKGPLALLLPLAASVAYLLAAGRIREFFAFWGLRTWGLLLAGCAVWFSAVWLEGGSGYLSNLLFHQTIGRAVNSFTHDEPFYYYALSLWYCLAPWSLLVAGMFLASMRRRVVRSELQVFFISAVCASFVLLSCVSSKLQIYMLPVIPLLVYAAAMFLPRWSGNRLARLSLAVPAAVFAVALPALIAVCRIDGLEYLNVGLLYAAATILSLAGTVTLWHLSVGHSGADVYEAVRRMGLGILLAVFVGGWAMPDLNGRLGYGNLCRQALSVAKGVPGASFTIWHIPRSENVDVYLGSVPHIVPDDSLPAIHPGSSTVLLTKLKDACRFAGCRVYPAGRYAVVAPLNSNQKSNHNE